MLKLLRFNIRETMRMEMRLTNKSYTNILNHKNQKHHMLKHFHTIKRLQLDLLRSSHRNTWVPCNPNLTEIQSNHWWSLCSPKPCNVLHENRALLNIARKKCSINIAHCALRHQHHNLTRVPYQHLTLRALPCLDACVVQAKDFMIFCKSYNPSLVQRFAAMLHVFNIELKSATHFCE